MARGKGKLPRGKGVMTQSVASFHDCQQSPKTWRAYLDAHDEEELIEEHHVIQVEVNHSQESEAMQIENDDILDQPTSPRTLTSDAGLNLETDPPANPSGDVDHSVRRRPRGPSQERMLRTES